MANLLRTSTAALVTRMLEDPGLVHVVQELPAAALVKLIDHVGLEDMGEVVALATTSQLERIFDEDVWRRGKPGEDESFDAARFGLWLEVLLEAGEAALVEKVAAMDEDFLALAVSRLALVVDIDALAQEMSSREERSDDDELLDKALEGTLYEEMEQYRVIAREPRHWDALVTMLTALDRDHHDLVERVLERCCQATSTYVEDNGGLYEVLTSDEMLESDVAGEREDRREREGFVPPTQAAAFLRLARTQGIDEITSTRAPDPVTKAHFRASRATPPKAPSPKVQAFLRDLGKAGVLEAPAPRRRRLSAQSGAGEPLLAIAMRALRERDAALFGKRVEELAYLVNLLVAVSGGGDGASRPAEAADVVTAVASLGLTRLGHDLVAHDAVKAFRVGWHLVGDEAWTAAGLSATAARALRGCRSDSE